MVAAAGYGKTTALRRMFPGPAVGWHRDGDVGALIGGGLAELAAGSSQIVVDDLSPMSDSPGHVRVPSADSPRDPRADLLAAGC